MYRRTCKAVCWICCLPTITAAVFEISSNSSRLLYIILKQLLSRFLLSSQVCYILCNCVCNSHCNHKGLARCGGRPQVQYWHACHKIWCPHNFFCRQVMPERCRLRCLPHCMCSLEPACSSIPDIFTGYCYQASRFSTKHNLWHCCCICHVSEMQVCCALYNTGKWVCANMQALAYS